MPGKNIPPVFHNTMTILQKSALNVLVCILLTLSCSARTGVCGALIDSSPGHQPAPSLESRQERPQEHPVVPDDGAALRRLEREVRRLAALAGGTVGISAVHIESGRCFSLNGAERFPMASAYKIPIAVRLLMQVDRGEISLDQTVTLRNSDIHPGSGRLITTLRKKSASYTVRELLDLMLLVSDNTASDALLKLAGGPKAVTAALQTLGIEDIDVSRSTLNMLSDWRGIEELPAPEDFTVDKYNRLRNNVSADVLETAQNRFYSDIRDTATPDAMTRLVAMVYCGSVLKPDTKSLLFKIMENCQTGKSRIRGLIPPGMSTANKTGTIGKGIVNDVALLTLPEGTGHVALTIFIKASDHGVSRQEQTMAQIARYLYDYYFFQGTAPSAAAVSRSCAMPDPICCRQ